MGSELNIEKLIVFNKIIIALSGGSCLESKVTKFHLLSGILRGPQQPHHPIHRSPTEHANLNEYTASTVSASQPTVYFGADNIHRHSHDEYSLHVSQWGFAVGHGGARVAEGAGQRKRPAPGAAERQRAAAEVPEGPGGEAEGPEGRTD